MRKIATFTATPEVTAARGTVEVRVMRDSDWDQWVCMPYVFVRHCGKTLPNSPAAYYTDDKADALATAQLMATV
jgi:hypothetical protein